MSEKMSIEIQDFDKFFDWENEGILVNPREDVREELRGSSVIIITAPRTRWTA